MMSKEFTDKNQIQDMYINYMEKVYADVVKNTTCPNHSREITQEDFETSAEMLAEPYLKAVGA